MGLPQSGGIVEILNFLAGVAKVGEPLIREYLPTRPPIAGKGAYSNQGKKKPARSVPTHPLPVFDIPASYALFPNYPNPFNAGTTIPFELPERSSVLIEVYDLLGRSVVTLVGETIERGHRTVRWTPLQSTGVYIVRMNATSLESQRSWSGTRKVVLMR